jgi:hypothetical protein
MREAAHGVWLVAGALVLGACSRVDPPRATWQGEGGSGDGGPRVESFALAFFSEIVASDEQARSVWLARNATDTELREFVRVRVDDGRILERGSTSPLATQSHHEPPFTMTMKRTPTWEPDGTYDVCFFLRSSVGRSKAVDCMKAVIGPTSRCDGGVCTLFANSNAGPVVFTLADESTGEVLGSGSLQSSSLDAVATRAGRVAMRFGVSQAVIDLRSRQVFERIPVPDETGEIHALPLVWFGDDELLSCEFDPHADRRRPCKRIDILPLADTTKWRPALEHIRFEFAPKRRPL